MSENGGYCSHCGAVFSDDHLCPGPLLITDRRSHDLMWMFISNRQSFTKFVEDWFHRDPERLATFLSDLDKAGLKIVKSSS